MQIRLWQEGGQRKLVFMSTIEAILFDFGGTLDSDGLDWFTRIYQAVVKRIGHFDRDVFQNHADQAANDISLIPDTRLLTMDETAARLCHYIHNNMTRHNGSTKQWDPDEVALEFFNEAGTFLERNCLILQQLSQRYRIGCISNNWGNTLGWCRQFQLHQYFETVIDSTVIGCVKPDRAIFQAALDDLKISAESCAYIGDKYDPDVLGSHGAGMTPVWILPAERRDECIHLDSQQIAPRCINQLSDLLTISWEA